MIAALIVITLLTALVATEPDTPAPGRAPEPDPLVSAGKKIDGERAEKFNLPGSPGDLKWCGPVA